MTDPAPQPEITPPLTPPLQPEIDPAGTPDERVPQPDEGEGAFDTSGTG